MGEVSSGVPVMGYMYVASSGVSRMACTEGIRGKLGKPSLPFAEWQIRDCSYKLKGEMEQGARGWQMRL